MMRQETDSIQRPLEQSPCLHSRRLHSDMMHLNKLRGLQFSAATVATTSLHTLGKLLAFLDGAFQLRNGICYHLLFKRRDLADAQIFLNAVFPK